MACLSRFYAATPINPLKAVEKPCYATRLPICSDKSFFYYTKVSSNNMATHSKQRAVTLAARTDTLMDLMRGRRSVRQFQDRAVDRALVEQILEAARWAPSPHGRQPWRFVVLTRPELKTRLADYMGKTWKQNLEMDGQDAAIVNIRLEKSRQRILHAPALIIP